MNYIPASVHQGNLDRQVGEVGTHWGEKKTWGESSEHKRR